MGIVGPLLKDRVDKVKTKAQKKKLQEKALDVLVEHTRNQKRMWDQVVKAREKLIGEAMRENEGNNAFLKALAEKFAKIKPPR
jgi:hypothetical protein